MDMQETTLVGHSSFEVINKAGFSPSQWRATQMIRMVFQILPLNLVLV